MGGMADRLEKQGEHPVAYGLLALVGVGVVVGLVLGLAALAGTRVLGVGDPATASTGEGEQSMYLPKLEKTRTPTAPELTLAPGEETPSASESEAEETESEKPEKPISLSAAQTTVAPMANIDLTGVYPGGEGAILQVQRFESGGWQDFPASPVSVSDQTFSTYVQTGQPGVQRFRMLDTGNGEASNVVKVTVA